MEAEFKSFKEEICKYLEGMKCKFDSRLTIIEQKYRENAKSLRKCGQLSVGGKTD